MSAETSVPVGADIAAAAIEMDQYAKHLDVQAAEHADRAAAIKHEVRAEAAELIQRAQNLADRRIAEEDAKAAPEEEIATKLRAQAEYWRGLAKTQRDAAGVPEPQTVPPGRPLGAQAPIPWTDPKGITWDLSLTYAGDDGTRWLWSERHGPCGVHPGDWPLMNTDDFGNSGVPFCETVPLRLASEVDQTGQFPQAPRADLDQVAATPAAVTTPDAEAQP